MLEWIHSTTTALGYPGIALLMFIENIFPPFPSELIMPLAGFAAAQGDLSFVGVVLAGSAGSLLGQLPYYLLGRWVGEEPLIRWADRYGKFFTLSGEDIRWADRWFHRYGAQAVFFGRLVPGLRSLIPLPAGLSRMPVVWFLLYSLFGTVVWTFLMALLGFILRQNYHLVNRYLGPVALVVVGILLVVALGWLVQRLVAHYRSVRS
jgi:membrane protein DedA with SNARE-associated domain